MADKRDNDDNPRPTSKWWADRKRTQTTSSDESMDDATVPEWVRDDDDDDFGGSEMPISKEDLLHGLNSGVYFMDSDGEDESSRSLEDKSKSDIGRRIPPVPGAIPIDEFNRSRRKPEASPGLGDAPSELGIPQVVGAKPIGEFSGFKSSQEAFSSLEAAAGILDAWDTPPVSRTKPIDDFSPFKKKPEASSSSGAAAFDWNEWETRPVPGSKSMDEGSSSKERPEASPSSWAAAYGCDDWESPPVPEAIPMDQVSSFKKRPEASSSLGAAADNRNGWEALPPFDELSSFRKKPEASSSLGATASSASGSDLDDLDEPPGPETLEPLKIQDVIKSDVTFCCRFHVPPKVQKYYYSPELDEQFRGMALKEGPRKPLLCSPQFEGNFKTKWRVLLNLNQWVETTRWVSVYLSRVESEEDVMTSLMLQCECTVTNDCGKVLHTRKTGWIPNQPKEINGFSDFSLFSDVVKMLSKDYLYLTIELSLMHSSPPRMFDDVEAKKLKKFAAKTEKKRRKRAVRKVTFPKKDVPASTAKPGEVEVSRGTLESLETWYEDKMIRFFPVVEPEDAVEFFLDGESVGCVTRTKLFGASEFYQQQLQSNLETSFSAVHLIREPDVNLMTIFEYLSFVESSPGPDIKWVDMNFTDLCNISSFAIKMGTPKLAQLCHNGICRNASLAQAPMVFFALRASLDTVDQDILEDFRRFLRKNIRKLQEDELFLKLTTLEEDAFMDFILKLPPQPQEENEVGPDHLQQRNED